MHNVDFTESDLQNASFSECDLTNSIFDSSNLESCDFLTAKNFVINPANNTIKNATFSKENCFGLLNSLQIKIR